MSLLPQRFSLPCRALPVHGACMGVAGAHLLLKLARLRVLLLLQPMSRLVHWSSESLQLRLAQQPGLLILELELQVLWKAVVVPLTALLLLRQQDQLELQRQVQAPE